MPSPWLECENCKIPTPRKETGECVFCDTHKSFAIEIEPAELERKLLAGRAAATGELARSGLKHWVMSLFWREN